MVVGLSILTFGSAAATGTDGVAPIFEIPNVDRCDLGGDLDVGGSGGDVVPGGPPGHVLDRVCCCSFLLLWVLNAWWRSISVCGGSVRGTDGFQESSPPYVCVAVCGNDYI